MPVESIAVGHVTQFIYLQTTSFQSIRNSTNASSISKLHQGNAEGHFPFGPSVSSGGEPGRGGMVYRPTGLGIGHPMIALQFDCSGITSKPTSASLRLHASGSGVLTNIASDHKFVLAKATGNLINASATAGPPNMATLSLGDVDEYDGHTTNSTAYSLTEYATFNPANLQSAGDVLLITLSDQALNDLASQDAFVFYILDKTYQVDNNDPFTSAPSAGALTDVRITITAGGTGANVPRLIVDVDNRVRDQKPDKDRIEKDFTVNTFADITQQRTRFSKDGVVVDQVPFLLGVKGPLSLRGRKFDDDGKPASIIVDPPNTSKS